MAPPSALVHDSLPRSLSVSAMQVRDHLAHLLQSPNFDASSRSREFLLFVVEEALAGRGDHLNQTAIAVAVFGRTADFDAHLDPVVRVQAGRLRRSLERYYLLSDDVDATRIELIKGRYAPTFTTDRSEPAVACAEAPLERAASGDLVSDRPSLVIHLLTTPHAEDADTASRIKDELIAELSRYGEVQIVRKRYVDKLDAPQVDAFRFELRGSLRRDAGGFIVCVQLMDRVTGEQIWGDDYHTAAKAGRWSGTTDDIARVIAARVGSEQGVIARTLGAECADRPTRGVEIGTMQRAYHFFFSRDVSDLVPVIHAMERFTVRRPENALAWLSLSRLYQVNHAFELSAATTPIERAIACANQGLLLDPASPRARCVMGSALLIGDELDAALHMLDGALRLNGDSFAYREAICWLIALAGDWDRGIALMREAVEKNPYCFPQVQHGLWADCLRRGEFSKAYVAALEYRDATFFWRPLMLASCLGHMGRANEARAALDELLAAKPDFRRRGRILIGRLIKEVELQERIIEGLREARLLLI